MKAQSTSQSLILPNNKGKGSLEKKKNCNLGCALVHEMVDSRSNIREMPDSTNSRSDISLNSSLKIEEAEWLTSKEAAEYLRVSEATLRNMVSSGRVPYFKFGRSNRYLLKELRQLLLSKRRGVTLWE